MSDNGFNVHSGLKQHAHLVPGFVHLPTINAFDREHAKYDLVPVNCKLLIRDTEQSDTSAVEHIVDHLGKRRWHAGHFESHVKALFHSKFSLHIFYRFLFDIDRDCYVAHFFGERQAEWIHIRDDNMSCSGMTSSGRSHYPDGTGTRYEHILTE